MTLSWISSRNQDMHAAIRTACLTAAATALLLPGSCRSTAARWPGACEYRQHVIESNIPDGYAMVVSDFNHDGRPDILGVAARASAQIGNLSWYENPTWERHLAAERVNGLVYAAPHDIDGDGIPELALASEFDMVAAKSKGVLALFQYPGVRTTPWKRIKNIDSLATSHHLAWADIAGDGKKWLINGPLIGSKALAPRYEDRVSLVCYRVPNDWTGQWQRQVINDQMTGVLHRIRIVRWDGDQREQLLTAGFNGILLHRAVWEGDSVRWTSSLLAKGHQEEPPRAGTSDVALGRLNGRRFLAAVEPWHGNEVVVYTEDEARQWQRRVIFSGLTEGHEVCLGDFNGDGRDDIVAGDRAKGHAGSSHIFYARDDRGNQWHHQILDQLGMSGSSCAVADLNGDGRPDPVLIGGGTHNIKWYENMGPSR